MCDQVVSNGDGVSLPSFHVLFQAIMMLAQVVLQGMANHFANWNRPNAVRFLYLDPFVSSDIYMRFF